MDEKTKESIQYRFSGYQLPKIQLDATGAAYYILPPHPYYRNQPLYWQKPYWTGSYPNTSPRPSVPEDAMYPTHQVTKPQSPSLYPLLPVCEKS